MGARLIGLDAAHQIITSQVEDDEIGHLLLRIEREGQPPQPRRAGITRNTRIADHGVNPARAQGILQLRRIARFLPHAISGEQAVAKGERSEEHTSELQSLMRIPYAVVCLTKKIYCYIIINLRKNL